MRKIGFWSENEQSKEQKNETTQFKAEKTEAKESVVRVYFPARGVVCFKRLLNQSVRKSLKTYKPTILGKERIANEKKRENHAIV